MSSNRRPSITHLFTSFLRLGITAFGGPSMVVYIRKMAVDKNHWLDDETFSDGIALCQIIPGATAMQTAAYVGLKTRGVMGAAASFTGFGLPAFMLMMVLAAIYTRVHSLPVFISIFSGLQAIIVAIVVNAAFSFGRKTIKSWPALAIAAIAAILFLMNGNPLLVIILAGLGGRLVFKPILPAQNQPAPISQAQSNTKALLLIASISAVGFVLLFLSSRTLFDLAALMFRIDLAAFGGGYASIPLMLHEIVDVRGWLDGTTFMNGIALGQVTPGPIVITATFIGYLFAGPLGGIVATSAIFLPSFLMVVGITPYFDRLRSSCSFNCIINGILCSFVGLLSAVTFRFAIQVHWDPFHLLLASGALAALLLQVDILWVVLAGIGASVFLRI